MLEKIKANLPILSICIVTLALLRQVAYYDKYDIPILNFVSIQEVLLYIIEDLFYVIPIIILIILFDEIFDKPIEPKSRIISRIERKKRRIFLIVYGILILALITFTVIIIIQVKNMANAIIMCVTVILLSIPLISVAFRNSPFIQSITKFQFRLFYYILFTILLTMMRVEHSLIQNDSGKFYGTYIKTDKKEYNIGFDTLYIGKTERYLFIHFRYPAKTEVINTEKIEAMTLNYNAEKN